MKFDSQEKLFSSSNRSEASLGKKLKIDILPEIEKVHKVFLMALPSAVEWSLFFLFHHHKMNYCYLKQRKERLLKKQHREVLLLDNFISLDGFGPGRARRDRKPVSYTFGTRVQLLLSMLVLMIINIMKRVKCFNYDVQMIMIDLSTRLSRLQSKDFSTNFISSFLKVVSFNFWGNTSEGNHPPNLILEKASKNRTCLQMEIRANHCISMLISLQCLPIHLALMMPTTTMSIILNN